MEFKLDETKVLESRMSVDGQSVRRRRVAPDGTVLLLMSGLKSRESL